jgi:hypothetical protein
VFSHIRRSSSSFLFAFVAAAVTMDSSAAHLTLAAVDENTSSNLSPAVAALSAQVARHKQVAAAAAATGGSSPTGGAGATSAVASADPQLLEACATSLVSTVQLVGDVVSRQIDTQQRRLQDQQNFWQAKHDDIKAKRAAAATAAAQRQSNC